MSERQLLARNVRKGMQVKDLDSGEWMTVQDTLHITSPAKVLVLFFSDGTRTYIHPSGRVLCRNAADGAS